MNKWNGAYLCLKEIKFEILFLGGTLTTVGYLFFYTSNDSKAATKRLNFKVTVIHLRKLFIKYLLVAKWASRKKIAAKRDKSTHRATDPQVCERRLDGRCKWITRDPTMTSSDYGSSLANPSAFLKLNKKCKLTVGSPPQFSPPARRHEQF